MNCSCATFIMSKEKREPEHQVELESHLVLRLPPEPAKALREVLKTGDPLKNRLSIQIDNDMRHGQVRFDHWLMHSKIVDLPTVIESLKTIDNKSFYKTADLCQMMICKEEPDQAAPEEDSSAKNKKKDPNKVDKKFLYPHGITPPTKNVRKRRFRKTLKKKCVEAPEIEKEVKRLLRADNEAVSVTWEIINEDEEEEELQSKAEPSDPVNKKPEKKQKSDRKTKRQSASKNKKAESSKVVDIFGGAVSDSDLEEDNVNVDLGDSHVSTFDIRFSDNSFNEGELSNRKDTFPVEFNSHMFQKKKVTASCTVTSATCGQSKSSGMSSEEDVDSRSHDLSKDNMAVRLEQLKAELDELKQRRQRTQHEITGMQNMALKQRFQDILQTMNQDIMYKDMEYHGLLTLQNSEDI